MTVSGPMANFIEAMQVLTYTHYPNTNITHITYVHSQYPGLWILAILCNFYHTCNKPS